MRRSSISLFLIALLAAVPLWPREDDAACGTHAAKAPEMAAVHRRADAVRGARAPLLQAGSPRTVARDIGEIAVLGDSGDIIAPPHPFNLGYATVTFTPAGAGASNYRYQSGEASYDSQSSAAGAKLGGLGDDDGLALALPFAFPFFGREHENVFVNSDGNLTFGAADASSSARSLGRLTAGPPRIAALFRDLDPSRPQAEVRTFVSAERVVVSWIAVPEFASAGTGPRSTFQVRLFPSGRIEFAYASVASGAAVVGISPGRSAGPVSLVSFRTGSGEEQSGTVAERFTDAREIDIYAAAARFYQSHEDAYDYLAIFNDMGVAAAPGALAYEATVRTLNRTGYGETGHDTGVEMGSPRRLQSVLNMGPLGQYPASPDSRIRNRGETTGDTGLTILGHEAGHLFLAFASVRDPLDHTERVMLKPDGAHWSFNFNSEASLLEGNRIRDNGDGTFTTSGTVEGYSALDRYLMGLIPASEVPPMFVVRNSSMASSEPPSARPVTFLGTRRDITIEELVRTEGLRKPGPAVSQRRFRCAFILVVAEGSHPDDADLEKLENYRLRFEDDFAVWTGGEASMETALRRAVNWSVAPSSGVLVGRTVTAAIAIEKPAVAELTFALSRQGSTAFTSAPASVTIPAGAARATFEIAGLAPGVDDLVAQPSDAAYETTVARLRVTASPASLRLGLEEAGDPVRMQVADLDNVPHGAVRVFSAVTPAGVWSDTNGLVEMARDGAGGVIAQVEAGGHATVDGIVNAASYVPGLAPGSFAAVFGSGFGADAGAGLPPYPVDLGNVRVWVDGKPAGLHYAAQGQVNFVVPGRAGEGLRDVFISSAGGTAELRRLEVSATAPGIFAAVRSSNYFEVYCTGLGADLPVAVILGGRRLAPTWSGPHPSYPGLYQVNVEIPAGLAGEQMLSIEAASRASNEVRVSL